MCCVWEFRGEILLRRGEGGGGGGENVNLRKIEFFEKGKTSKLSK